VRKTETKINSKEVKTMPIGYQGHSQNQELYPCTIYTIVHTSVDIDRASFPPAIGKASFTDFAAAQAELRRLVAAEKDTLELPFDADEYREEYGEDYWEGYQDGYAAGWFTRFEIVTSPLVLGQDKKRGNAP
jgi:hypothetical protein